MSSYIEKVLWKLLKSSFSKKTFCYLLISIVSLLFRIHVDSIIAIMLYTPYNLINFVFHIIISTLLIINSKYFYDIVQRYEPEFYDLVKYFINNYTDQNFKRWKRKLNIIICLYIFVLTFLIEISNNSIRQIIIEYIVCYFLIESYEKYNDGKFKGQNKEFEFIDENILNNLQDNENYDKELFDIKKS
jgi:hypothetical protein